MADLPLDTIHRLRALVELMAEIGSTDMGHVPYRQAARYHKLTEKLARWIDEVADPDTSP